MRGLCVYIRTKFQVFSIILISFKQGGVGVIFAPPPRPLPQNKLLKCSISQNIRKIFHKKIYDIFKSFLLLLFQIFNEATFREVLLSQSWEKHLSKCSRIKLVHDVINLLHYERRTEKQKYFYVNVLFLQQQN